MPMTKYFAEFEKLYKLGIKIPEDKIIGYFIEIEHRYYSNITKKIKFISLDKYERSPLLKQSTKIPATDADTLWSMIPGIIIKDYENNISFDLSMSKPGYGLMKDYDCENGATIEYYNLQTIDCKTLTAALLSMLIWLGENYKEGVK